MTTICPEFLHEYIGLLHFWLDLPCLVIGVNRSDHGRQKWQMGLVSLPMLNVFVLCSVFTLAYDAIG